MRIVLICHEKADLTRMGLARWLAFFFELAGIIVIREKKTSYVRRIRFEIKRVGLWRLCDVVAFRLFYALFLRNRDRKWEREKLEELCQRYPAVPPGVPVLYTHNPNSPESERFIKSVMPDLMLARCKQMLKRRIFDIPLRGTIVLHPGICPEYRNAHGCFWALTNSDYDRVGMSLLRIDKGVDTGPVYGYYRAEYDALNDSHIVIQHKVVLNNLDALAKKISEIYAQTCTPLDVSGRRSAMWGQPWLTRYLRWRVHARKRET